MSLSKRQSDQAHYSPSNPTKRQRITDHFPETELCSHCGGGIITERINDGGNIFHKDCIKKHLPECKEAVSILKSGNSNVTKVLFMGIDVHFLYGEMKETKEKKQEKKRMRDLKAKELLKYASALRNSNSGHLLIQLVGLSPADTFTGAFDEFADDKLSALIEDGSMFGNVYLKTRMVNMVLDSDVDLSMFKNCLVLYVGASRMITTSEFATKVPLDFSINDPSPFSMIKFIKEQKLLGQRFGNHASSNLKLSKIQESRDTQLKGTDKIDVGSNFALAEHIWEKLKLPDYICAFSKNQAGGRYFLGIGETTTVHPGYTYKTQINDVHGLSREQCEVIQKSIQDKIKQQILICDFKGHEIAKEFVNTEIKATGKEGKFVLMVSVQPVEGLAFSSRHGPLAYRVEASDNDGEDKVVRIPLSEWFISISNSTENTV